ncbi:hypothetical protein WKI13_02795 [Teredinibacter turnerae]|uniref:hypothetical protein n=1 Tax=Teredinibacter turnerae TaxID=2426 RepID=UPI0003668C92|nr:hypothetical protein [Teredinibacter turnerae]
MLQVGPYQKVTLTAEFVDTSYRLSTAQHAQLAAFVSRIKSGNVPTLGTTYPRGDMYLLLANGQLGLTCREKPDPSGPILVLIDIDTTPASPDRS